MCERLGKAPAVVTLYFGSYKRNAMFLCKSHNRRPQLPECATAVSCDSITLEVQTPPNACRREKQVLKSDGKKSETPASAPKAGY